MRPRVIKSSTGLETGLAPFNVSDALTEITDRAQAARQEIVDLQAQAQHNADQAYQTAHKNGFDAGYQAGLTQAKQEVEQRHQQELALQLQAQLEPTTQLLARVTEELRQSQQDWVSRWETEGIELAVQIAERIIHERLQQPNEVVRATLAQILSMIGRQPRVVILLAPADHLNLEVIQTGLTSTMNGVEQIEWRVDAKLQPGDCRIETQFGAVDASVATQLGRIASELLGSNEVMTR